ADLKPSRSLIGEPHINCVDDPKVELAIVEEGQEAACPGVGLNHRLKGGGTANHVSQSAGHCIENSPGRIRAHRHCLGQLLSLCQTEAEQKEHQHNAGRASEYVVPLNHRPSDLRVAPFVEIWL